MNCAVQVGCEIIFRDAGSGSPLGRVSAAIKGGAYEHEGHKQSIRAKFAKRLKAIANGHVHIANDHIRRMAIDSTNKLLAIGDHGNDLKVCGEN